MAFSSTAFLDVPNIFSRQMGDYLRVCSYATGLLTLGFGIKDRDDIKFLQGKADIAVIGTQAIGLMESKGISGLGAVYPRPPKLSRFTITPADNAQE